MGRPRKQNLDEDEFDEMDEDTLDEEDSDDDVYCSDDDESEETAELDFGHDRRRSYDEEFEGLDDDEE